MPNRNRKAFPSNRHLLKTAYDTRRPDYDEALSGLCRDVRALLKVHGYTPTIKYRIKRFNNYFGKLQKIHKGERGSEAGLITDLLGLRIICPFLEDLDIIEGLLSAHFQIIEAEMKVEKALAEIKPLQGVIPICGYGNKIRDDRGAWSDLRAYINSHLDAEFNYGSCPDCIDTRLKKLKQSEITRS